MTGAEYASYDWQEWAWACLFAGGAFYMMIDIGRRISAWFFNLVLPTRYTIPIGQGDEQNRVTVWAWSLERAIVKAAAKDGYQYMLGRISWTPIPWLKAQRLNLVWLTGYGWDTRKNIQSQQQGGIDSLIMMLIEQPCNCWAYRRELWLLCLRSAELISGDRANEGLATSFSSATPSATPSTPPTELPESLNPPGQNPARNRPRSEHIFANGSDPAAPLEATPEPPQPEAQ
jgi:hypothetical protein